MTFQGFAFDNTFARELEGFYAPSEAAGFKAPALVKLNRPLAEELGLDPDALAEAGPALFSGNTPPAGATPIAQAYAGHQFGGFSPRLGDGRALLLGEIVDPQGGRRDLQLKGSGPTPFSRGGDGKAALGPVLREYLIGEAMHALGVPTTRALAAVTTGEPVFRDTALPGAVLTRVAASHIRVGTFEFFASRHDHGPVRKLADYTIRRHYPASAKAENPYFDLLVAVGKAQTSLVARWMQIGFIHGVMNTDNVTVSGETIDYGPCAFMDAFDPATVFSSIDRRGRYAYGNQPGIVMWNLARFAETLLPLLADAPKAAIALAEEALGILSEHYEQSSLEGMRRKIGLQKAEGGDGELIEALLGMMESAEADFTSTFRGLAKVLRGASADEALQLNPEELAAWMPRWRARLDREGAPADAIATAMDGVNPIYIPRNHRTEEALEAAVQDGDMRPFDALLEAVTQPYEERPSLADYASPAPPEFGPYKTFCGT